MSTKPNTDAQQPALDKAFEDLKAYDAGAGRGCLLAIDDSTRKAALDKNGGLELEKRLLSLSQESLSVIAREYLCAKLAVIGSGRSVPLLTRWIADPEVSTAARNALERIPDPEAADELRASVRRLKGTLKAGVIRSLGNLRHEASVKVIGACLEDQDAGVAQSAADALGQIGTPRCARFLKAAYTKADMTGRSRLGDAVLVCAERLTAAKETKDARELYSLLASTDVAPHVQTAARRCLQ